MEKNIKIEYKDRQINIVRWLRNGGGTVKTSQNKCEKRIWKKGAEGKKRDVMKTKMIWLPPHKDQIKEFYIWCFVKTL